MAKEYIEREKAIEWFMAFVHMGESDIPAETVITDLKYAIPAADVAPVRYGRWEAWMPDKNGETREFICTGCRFMVEMSWKQKECDYEWCPYCGCKCECLPEPPKEDV